MYTFTSNVQMYNEQMFNVQMYNKQMYNVQMYNEHMYNVQMYKCIMYKFIIASQSFFPKNSTSIPSPRFPSKAFLGAKKIVEFVQVTNK